MTKRNPAIRGAAVAAVAHGEGVEATRPSPESHATETIMQGMRAIRGQSVDQGLSREEYERHEKKLTAILNKRNQRSESQYDGLVLKHRADGEEIKKLHHCLGSARSTGVCAEVISIFAGTVATVFPIIGAVAPVGHIVGDIAPFACGMAGLTVAGVVPLMRWRCKHHEPEVESLQPEA